MAKRFLGARLRPQPPRRPAAAMLACCGTLPSSEPDRLGSVRRPPRTDRTRAGRGSSGVSTRCAWVRTPPTRRYKTESNLYTQLLVGSDTALAQRPERAGGDIVRGMAERLPPEQGGPQSRAALVGFRRAVAGDDVQERAQIERLRKRGVGPRHRGLAEMDAARAHGHHWRGSILRLLQTL